MNSCYYYAFDDTVPQRAVNACSLSSGDYPLIVNCTGNVVTSVPLTTDNVRGREDYYLMYMVSGSLDVTVSGKVRRVSAGNAVIFPPRCHYRYVYSGEERLSYLWVHFTGSYAGRLLKACLMRELPCVLETHGSGKIADGFRRMFEIFESGGRLRSEELACALEALLLNLARASSDDDGDMSFERSLRYIHSSYAGDISVEELAKLENLSYYRYIKLFRAHMGMPPTAYIINLRMNTACDLLLKTDMSIKQVSVSVGYSDAHFFSRLFKKHTGRSPREYREGQQK